MAVSILLAALVTAPLTARGWLLLLDWVPGPAGVGTGVLDPAALPAGPAFLVPVAFVHTVAGAWVGWVPIALALGVAALGAGRLVGGPVAARSVAAIAYAWNPFVYDRIYAGHLALLAGYAVLPWLAGAILDTRRGPLRWWTVGLLWALAASCSLQLAWIGGVVLAAGVVVRTRHEGPGPVFRQAAGATALAAVVVGAWAVPLAVRAPDGGGRAALEAFATRADPALGRAAGLLAQQGFWRPAPERPRDDLGPAFPLVAGAVVAGAGAGLVSGRRGPARALALGTGLAAGAAWLLAHGGAGPAGWLYRHAVTAVPGFEVMREAQKWVMLVSLATAVGLGLLTAMVAGRLRRPGLASVLAVLPLVLAPTLAWGLAGRVETSRYPESWEEAAPDVERAGTGATVVLPWELYVRTSFTAERVVANPVPSFFGSSVVASRDAGLDGFPPEPGRRGDIAAAVDRARAAAEAGGTPTLGADLEALGASLVLVVGPDPRLGLERDPRLAPVIAAGDLELWAIRSAG